MTRVLVVDDEPQLLRALVLNLSNRGFDVVPAETAEAALYEFATLPPDLVVLDLGLPDRDGLEVIRQLRQSAPVLPIVVLSARAGTSDKVAALDLGAVDYVTKPFDMNELVARLRVVIRRATERTPSTVVTFGDVEVDVESYVAHRAGVAVHLTPTEWRILGALLSRPGRLVTQAELLRAADGDPTLTEGSYLRIYFAQLRRKLEADPSRPRHLLTEPGMGYRFEP